jgi:hypothetical protein
LAAALEDGLGQKSELVAGDDGVFDVSVDDHVVFSKQQRGEFIPTPEIVALVKTHLDGLKA